MPEKRASIHTREKSSTRSSPANHKFGLKVTVSTSRMCNSKCVKNRTNETVYWRRGGRRRREALHSVLVSNLRVSNSKAIEERERESWRESRPLELRFPGFRPLRNFAALVGRLRSKFSRAIIREEVSYRNGYIEHRVAFRSNFQLSPRVFLCAILLYSSIQLRSFPPPDLRNERDFSTESIVSIPEFLIKPPRSWWWPLCS